MSRSRSSLALLALTGALLTPLADAPSATAASGWSETGAMARGRGAFGVARLGDGRVLAISGYAAGGEVDGSELYDPASGTWTATGTPALPRLYATTTVLDDGDVLFAGGTTGTPVPATDRYDPATGAWTATGGLATARAEHVAVKLADGRVLVAGGSTGPTASTASAELFDPATGAWTPAAPMSVARMNANAALLPDGRVLVAGGTFSSGGSYRLHASAELYDPVTDSWSAAPPMSAGRAQGPTFALADGSVTVVPALSQGGVPNRTIERFDPAANAWLAAGSLPGAGGIGLADGALLADGRGLVSESLVLATPLLDPVSGDADTS